MSSAEAESALDRLNQVQDRVAQSDQLLSRTESLVNDVDSLHRHLLSTAELHNEAQLVADQMIEISETLVGESDEMLDAQLTLDDLVDLREQISEQSSDVFQSRQTLGEMVRLKDGVLAQTEHDRGRNCDAGADRGLGRSVPCGESVLFRCPPLADRRGVDGADPAAGHADAGTPHRVRKSAASELG